MDIEKTRELLPLFITGNLSTEDVLSVSRLLAQSPSLVGELRLTLALHDGLMRDAPLPPVSRRLYTTNLKTARWFPAFLRTA